MLKRLKEYEDTGLTPEQMLEMDKLYAEKCKEVASFTKIEGCTRGGKPLYVKEEQGNEQI